MDFALWPRAQVVASPVWRPRAQRPALHIVINDRIAHTFATGAVESQWLDHHTPGDIEALLSGGTFVIIAGRLADYRPADYNGFVHSPSGIEALLTALGAEPVNRRLGPMGVFGRSRREARGHFALGKTHPAQPLAIDALGEGGRFDVQVRTTWSPFSERIKQHLEVTRLACFNGMVAKTAAFRRETRLVSHHDDHLRLAREAFLAHSRRALAERLEQLARSPATVAELDHVRRLAQGRLKKLVPVGVRRRIYTLVDAVDPRRQDAPLPPPGPLRALTAGHLSRFDAINVVTELDTHAPGDEAAAKAVQAFINRLLTLPLGEEAVGHPPRLRLADSDPERAFFAGGEAVAAALAQGAEADPVAGEEA